MAIDDPQGGRGDCRPCLPLSRASDRRWPRRPGIGPSRKSRLHCLGGPQGWYGSGYDVRGDRHLEQAAEAGRVDGPRSGSAPTGDTREDDDGGTGSRAPSAAHAAGAFLPRKASQEPTPTRESFKRSVFKFKLLNRA
jgi:hypothetical protein